MADLRERTETGPPQVEEKAGAQPVTSANRRRARDGGVRGGRNSSAHGPTCWRLEGGGASMYAGRRRSENGHFPGGDLPSGATPVPAARSRPRGAGWVSRRRRRPPTFCAFPAHSAPTGDRIASLHAGTLSCPVSCKRYSFQKENQVHTAPTL